MYNMNVIFGWPYVNPYGNALLHAMIIFRFGAGEEILWDRKGCICCIRLGECECDNVERCVHGLDASPNFICRPGKGQDMI